MSYVDFPSVEMNCRDQPVFIATDIEYNVIMGAIRARKRYSQLIEAAIRALFHDFVPAEQRGFAIRMHPPEIAERFARYDMHNSSYLILR